MDFPALNIKLANICTLFLLVTVDSSSTENVRSKDVTLNFGMAKLIDCNKEVEPWAEFRFQKGYVKQIRLTIDYYKLILENWSQIEETTVEDILAEFHTRIKELQLKSEKFFSENSSKVKGGTITSPNLDELNRLDQLSTDLINELDVKLNERKSKSKEEKERWTTSMEKSNEAKKTVSYHVMEMAFQCDFESLKEELDESAWRVRGMDITKDADYILERIREMHRSAKRLDSLGYFAGTDENNEIEAELKILTGTQEKIVEYLKEHMSVIGPSQLVSFVMDTGRLLDAANEAKVQQQKDFEKAARKQLKELRKISNEMKEYRNVLEGRLDKQKNKGKIDDEL